MPVDEMNGEPDYIARIRDQAILAKYPGDPVWAMRMLLGHIDTVSSDLEESKKRAMQLESGDLVWAFKDRNGKITATTKWQSEAEVWAGMLGVDIDHAKVYKHAGYEVFQVRLVRVP